MWNLYKLYKNVLLSNEMCINWCQSIGLIKSSMCCPKCNAQMKLYYKRNEWRCRLNNHTVVIPICSNTWFQNHKISIEKILILTNMFANGNTKYTDMIRESSIDEKITSMHTVCDWLSYCREICLISLDHYYDMNGKIGGVGHIVQIDETKVGKRKYNKGRCVEGQWIIGMLDIGSATQKKCELRLELCTENKRDSKTLVALIQKHVKQGSTIYTDQWKAYDCLTKFGYFHQTVNHSENFVDPISGVHTQNIECEWRQLKRKLHSGGHHHEYLADYMCEFLWRKIVNFEKRDPFIEFIKAICIVYN